jgi:hypothetical protein
MSNLSTVFTTAVTNTAVYPGQSFFGTNNVQVFMSTGTYVVPAGVSQIRVRVHGAGGSGGGVAGGGRNRVASGGGGGGMSIKTLNVTAGTSYAVTVGAGGAAVTLSAANAGNAGGTSSFGAVCSATGGSGGAATTGNAVNSAAGATGGTGSGGDLNYTGGGSGIASTTTTNATYNSLSATGGGSGACIFGNGFSSGTATITGGGYSVGECMAASGGAGVGGVSGAALNSTDGYTNICTGGGGTAGPSKSNLDLGTFQIAGPGFLQYYSFPAASSVQSFAGPVGSMQNFCVYPAEIYNASATNASQLALSANNLFGGSYPANAVNRFFGDILISNAPPYSAGTFNVNKFTPPGTGGGANTPNVFANTTSDIFAGTFGGGSGTADTNNNGVRGGNATIAGGGGGAVGYSSTDASGRSGAGGSGMVIVEW